jgi:hypothetical protein
VDDDELMANLARDAEEGATLRYRAGAILSVGLFS